MCCGRLQCLWLVGSYPLFSTLVSSLSVEVEQREARFKLLCAKDQLWKKRTTSEVEGGNDLWQRRTATIIMEC